MADTVPVGTIQAMPGDTSPSTARLRPALQLALEVARAGGGRVPGRMRSLTQARRLPANWAGTARRVLEEDDAFRARVAAAATETAVGGLAWLWLARPEGWIDELQALLEESASSPEGPVEEVDVAASRLSEVEAELARARAELAALQAVSAEERRAQAKLIREQETRIEGLSKNLSERNSEIKELRAGVARLQADVEAATNRLERSERQRRAVATTAANLERDRDEAGRLADSAALRREALGLAVARAATAAHDLGEALGQASHALDPPKPDPPPSGPPLRRRQRTPIPLPPAVLEDSPEAAVYLVRAQGVLLIVDGYNVALTSWGSLDLPDLRQRLLDALAELAVRLKLPVVVVFDGAAEGGRTPPPRSARPWMTVEFSPSTVEADAVIVAAVDDLPPDRPVVVATNDREVQRQVRRRGSNVIGVNQLLAALGRSPTV